jgi:ketosteroid isomerase-like protein
MPDQERISAHARERPRWRAFAGMLLSISGALAACNSAKPALPHGDSSSVALAQANAERDSVRAMLKEFTGKMNSGDLDGAGRLYSDNSLFSWIENGSFPYHSANEVRASLQTLRNIPQIKLVYYETYIDVLAPGVATVRTEFSQTFMDKLGKGTTYGGYLTLTAVHEKDGWRMRNGHTSSRKPRPGL